MTDQHVYAPPTWEYTTAGEKLRRHARQIGADQAAATDPTAHFQLNMLRLFLNVAEAAMREEQVPTHTIDRVIERLIYGCLPNPVEVEERERVMRLYTDHLNLCAQPIRIPTLQEPTP